MRQIGTPYLFVYGTLKSEFKLPASRALRQMSVAVGNTSVRGTLYSCGWYPAVKLHARGRRVKGQLVRLKSPQKAIAFLDKYEGAYLHGTDYERQVVPVKMATGRMLPAQIYVYKPCCKMLPVIRSGVFGRSR